MAFVQFMPHPVDRFPPTPPKSYADAVEHKERRDYLVNSSFDIDEELIKETPPRLSHEPSSPRSLGEVLNDEDSSESPRPHTPTIIRKPAPGLCYADAVAHSLTPSRSSQDYIDRLEVERRSDSVSEGSPRSPLRRMKKRIPSHTLDGGEREVNSSMESKLFKEKHDAANGETAVSLRELVDDKEEAQQNVQERGKLQTGSREVSDVSEHEQSSSTMQSKPQKENHDGVNGEATTTLREPVADYQESRKDLLDQEKIQAEEGKVQMAVTREGHKAGADSDSEPILVSGKSARAGRR